MITTIVDIKKIDYCDNLYRVYTGDGKSFVVKVENWYSEYGFVIKPYGTDTSLKQFAEFVTGCFKVESNFFSTFDSKMQKVKIEYDDMSTMVSYGTACVQAIIQRCYDSIYLGKKEKRYKVGLRKDKNKKGFDKVYSVLAFSEQIAIHKVLKMCDGWCECICLGRE